MSSSIAMVTLCFGLSTAASHAQTYPTHPIRLIVPFAAGRLDDTVARLIAPELEKALGQAVTVDNQPDGGSGGGGTEAAAKAPPDGHTLLLVGTQHAIAAVLNATLPYDVERDFAPISFIATIDMIFFLNPKVPVNHFTAFIERAQQNPDKFSYASPGAGSQSHILIELLSRRARMTLRHIPHRGDEPAAMAVVSGAADLTLLPPYPVFAHIAAGTLRPIAAAGYGPHPLLPNVQLLAGFPAVLAIQWMGIVAPAGTPKEIVDRLSVTLHRILYRPDITQRLAERGITRTGSKPEQFQTLLSNQLEEWRENVREANVTKAAQ